MPDIWNANLDRRLLKAKEAGASFAEIGQRLGVSRRVAVGRDRRFKTYVSDDGPQKGAWRTRSPMTRSPRSNERSAVTPMAPRRKRFWISCLPLVHLRTLQIACRERALSTLHQITQQVRRHRQLGERQTTGSDLLDRTADARRFRMGRKPCLGGLLAGLAGCQHIGN